MSRIIRRVQDGHPGVAPLHENPLVSRVLAARGVQSAGELDYALKDLPSPQLLPAIDVAVERLAAALDQQQRIMIIGDYDCDGATSTSVALLALTAMGAQHVSYRVPNRFEYGYGLSAEIVDVAAQDEPALIVTVDNGVASVDGVARAQELGIDVIVTDHHLPPDVLPEALAIVNPNLANSRFPSTALAGVGVIFYVMLALRTHLVAQGWFEQCNLAVPNLAQLLDLVAIGTVADVVPLDQVNRILVEQGLRRIRAGRTRPGVDALIRIAGRDPAALAATDIGFAVGPRLNAAGRLDDISTGIACLLSGSAEEAGEIAAELNALNQARRDIELQMRGEASTLVEQTLARLAAAKQNLMSLCLADPGWHQGVIGILAGRLKEALHVPVVVFAAADDGSLKGSGRSVPGLHIRDVLESVATANPGLIQKFGGHAMAAGLSLQSTALERFRQAFDHAVVEQLDGRALDREWHTDGELAAAELQLENARILRFVAPWGRDFPEPTFDGIFIVQSVRELKQQHLKLVLTLPGSARTFDAIAFNQRTALRPQQSVRLVFRLDVNTYRASVTLQLHVLHIELPNP